MFVIKIQICNNKTRIIIPPSSPRIRIYIKMYPLLPLSSLYPSKNFPSGIFFQNGKIYQITDTLSSTCSSERQPRATNRVQRQKCHVATINVRARLPRASHLVLSLSLSLTPYLCPSSFTYNRARCSTNPNE